MRITNALKIIKNNFVNIINTSLLTAARSYSLPNKSGTFALTDILFDKTDIGYDIIIGAGASNIVGFGEGIDTNFDYVHPRVLQYPAMGDYFNKIIQAKEPLTHHNPTERPNAVGALLTLGKLIADILPANRKVLIVPCALQGTNFANGDWNPGNPYYNFMVTRVNNVISTFPKSRVLLMPWTIPGGNDTLSTSTTFKNQIDNFIQGARTSITGASNLPVIVFGSTQQIINVDTNRARLTTDMLDTPNRLPRVSSINVSDLKTNDEVLGNGDTLHFSAQAQRIIGERLFSEYLAKYFVG